MGRVNASTDGDTGRPELSGGLSDFTLAELFELFAATAKSGVIRFGEPVGADLWLVDGLVTYGTSPGSVDPRSLLERQGILTAGQFDEAVAATGADQALHETLQRRFGVDPAQLEALAREQIIATTFEIVVVGAESFEFRSDGTDPLGAAVAMPHAEVLEAAQRRREEWSRIVELIPSTDIVTTLDPDAPDGASQITVTAEQWQILAHLDGHRSVAGVIEELGQSAFEVCVVLYDLLAAGTIQVVEPATHDLDHR